MGIYKQTIPAHIRPAIAQRYFPRTAHDAFKRILSICIVGNVCGGKGEWEEWEEGGVGRQLCWGIDFEGLKRVIQYTFG